MTDAAHLRRRMVDDLTASGELIPAWREAFFAVPRHAFIPDLVWRRDLGIEDDNDLVPFCREDDPDEWLERAYAHRAVITQVDDGNPVGPGCLGREMTSSASQPNVVALMLAALDAEPGMTVCEIGTGTGYNAALLAARLGAGNVTTIEVDPQLAAQARKALDDAGYAEVTVVSGDGAQGYPPRAPYDRVLATCAVYRVPYAWVAQTRPGGRVVTPWESPYESGGLLSLTVGDDGTAVGGIVGNVAFMCLRDQRVPSVSIRECVYDEDNAVVTTTDVHPYRVASYDATFAIGLRVQDCRRTYPAEGAAKLWFLDPASRSWASVDYVDNGPHEVRQLGPRRLWDEVEAAYRWWLAIGSPKAEQWRFTVTPEGQQIDPVY